MNLKTIVRYQAGSIVGSLEQSRSKSVEKCIRGNNTGCFAIRAAIGADKKEDKANKSRTTMKYMQKFQLLLLWNKSC